MKMRTLKFETLAIRLTFFTLHLLAFVLKISKQYLQINLIFKIMKKQFLKIAFRQITRHKLFSIVNIFGLSIGIASVILISLWIQDESTYDKCYPDHERIYRLVQDFSLNDTKIISVEMFYNSYYGIKEQYPEIEKIARISKPTTSFVKIENRKYKENRIFYADNEIIDILGLNILQGEKQSALHEPNTAIISSNKAKIYFGTSDVVGKSFLYEGKIPIKITAIFEDLPANNHFDCDLYISINNIAERTLKTIQTNNRCLIYVKLKPNVNPDEFETKLLEFVRVFYGKIIQRFLGISFDEYLDNGNYFNLRLQSISNAHFDDIIEDDINTHGNRQHIYILGLISLVILIVAIINFINLSSARALYRAKEVSIKKILGASRSLLIKQFTIEAILYALIALNIGLLIVEFLLPLFNQFTAKDLSVGYLENPIIIILLIISGLLLGLISGLYPAFLISSFKPLSIFSNDHKKLKGVRFRNLLIGIQFFISLSIITCTLVINSQLKYINNKDWGFTRDGFLIVKNISALNNQEEIFKRELKSNNSILGVTLSSTLPGKELTGRTYAAKGKGVDENVTMLRTSVDYDFLKTYELKLIDGRYFSEDNVSDINQQTAIINQAAAKVFGFDNPVGQKFYRIDSDHLKEDITIVGVVKDFHYQSLYDQIYPCIIRPNWSSPKYMSIKVDAKNIEKTIQFVNSTWDKFSEQAFEYSFLEDDLMQLHKNEYRNKTLFFIFSILSIIVSSLGLFGMTVFTISRKTKEIGIKKALGAPLTNITLNLLKQTLILFSVAAIISIPICYYFMNNWLNNFVFRINIGFGLFLEALIIVLAISVSTIIFLVVKAAKSNPVDTLRYE